MIGILVATDIEMAAIKEVTKITSQKEVAGRTFYYGTINDKDVVLGHTGVGKSHAAMTTTILCLNHDLDYIINTGTAGGIKEYQQVLDVVIGDKVIQADYDTSPIDGQEGIGLVYPMDTAIVQSALEVAQKAELSVHVGTIASQDRFMARPEDFQQLMERFPDAICCEMEAGAVGQVSKDFKVQAILIRCLSDVVIHDDNPMEYLEYAQLASKQIARWIQLYI